MADIFLSYAREDAERARQVARNLESLGWSVWWDRRIPPGQDFTTYIQQQLDVARCIVVMWSKAAVGSQFVRDEAAEGRDNGKLVPLMLETIRQPLGFRQLQAADLSKWKGEAAHDEFERLIGSIRSIVAPGTPAPAAPLTSNPTRESGSSAPRSAAAVQLQIDVFISYAHLDNVELIEGKQGWVTYFSRALEIRLGQLLGRTPRVFVDRKLSGNDAFSDTLTESLGHVAVFLAVVSPRYVKSDWTRRELQEFHKAAETQGGIRVQDKSRVVKVLKTPTPLDNQPQELKETLGYEFFRVDPANGRFREFRPEFGPDSEREFWLKLDDLVHDIADLLSHSGT